MEFLVIVRSTFSLFLKEIIINVMPFTENSLFLPDNGYVIKYSMYFKGQMRNYNDAS